MNKTLVTILCLLLSAGIAGADPSTPGRAVAELESQLNSRFIDAIVGPVDFDFAYVKEGTHAHPLSAMLAGRAEDAAVAGIGGQIWWDTARPLTAEPGSAVMVRRVHRVPAGGSLAVPGSVDSSGFAGELTASDSAVAPAETFAVVTAGSTATGDAGTTVLDTSLSGSRPEPTRQIVETYVYPFVPTDRPVVGSSPVMARHVGDQVGDPASFDLDSVDPDELGQIQPPALYRDIEGVELGVRMAPPYQPEADAVTLIEAEHSLAERRVLRLLLRRLYADWPARALLELEVEEVEADDKHARATVSWAMVGRDGEVLAAGTHGVALRLTNGAWRLERSWDLIGEIIAGV